MKVAVLGTGMVGTAIVHELARNMHPVITEVMAVDAVQDNLLRCLSDVKHSRVSGKVVSLDQRADVEELLSDMDLAIACLPHSLSYQTIEAAIETRCHIVDLVGSEYKRKIKLNDKAKATGVIIVPGCGVAPGIVNILAARGVELLDEADEAVMMCGGLPRHPRPPLWYQIVFRLESVMGLYMRQSIAMENGEIVELGPFSGKETVMFPEPVGECEAIYSDPHSVIYTLQDKIKHIYEKTLRYKGHFEKMKVLHELGLLDDTPILVDGQFVSPKKLTMAVLEPQLIGESKEDITALRVIVKGKKGANGVKLEWEMIDVYDYERDITSMAKTTGFPAIIMCECILSGKIKGSGVLAPEELIGGELYELFIDELKERGIVISFKEEVVDD